MMMLMSQVKKERTSLEIESAGSKARRLGEERDDVAIMIDSGAYPP